MRQIEAQEIIKSINEGKNIHYENVEVIGDLDFTSVRDVAKEKANTYRSYINSAISFEKCVFKGKIIGYKSKNDGSTTHSTTFLRNIFFIDSVVEGEFQFKKSIFWDYC